MAHYLIRSKHHQYWHVRVANCSAEHAESVRDQLERDPSVPGDLDLIELDRPYDKAPKRRFWSRSG